MDVRTFLDLRPTHNPFRWILPITDGICGGGGQLFGGAGLAAAIEAMEGVTKRPCVWATAQYLSNTGPDTVMDIDVTVAISGHQVSQARAVGHVGNDEILTVNAALGTRSFPRRDQWTAAPQAVPAPDASPARPFRNQRDNSISSRLDLRIAKGRLPDELDGERSPDGRTIYWARMPEVLEPSAASLAILGDFVPSGVGQALGRLGGGTSLDNTLRVARVVPSPWVLIDIQAEAVERGFGHGYCHMYSVDGTLMATASQSCIVRSPLPG